MNFDTMKKEELTKILYDRWKWGTINVKLLGLSFFKRHCNKRMMKIQTYMKGPCSTHNEKGSVIYICTCSECEYVAQW